MLSLWCGLGVDQKKNTYPFQKHRSLPLSICLRKPLWLETLILPHLHQRAQRHDRHDRLGAKLNVCCWCEHQVECRNLLEWLHKHFRKSAWGLDLRFSCFLRSVQWHCESFQPNPTPISWIWGQGFQLGHRHLSVDPVSKGWDWADDVSSLDPQDAKVQKLENGRHTHAGIEGCSRTVGLVWHMLSLLLVSLLPTQAVE